MDPGLIDKACALKRQKCSLLDARPAAEKVPDTFSFLTPFPSLKLLRSSMLECKT